jgi:hypothetical protein
VTHLTGDEIRPSALYTMPHRVRFELGPHRHAQAVERANALYDAVFGRARSLLVVAYVWRPDEIDAVVELLGEAAVELSDDPNPYDDPAEGSPATKIVATVSPAALDSRDLFARIAATDLGMTPALDAKVYLADPETGVVFHMYDDRGAFVGAVRPEPLDALREQFETWLVA